jgi:hypothetical protein
MSGPSRAPDGPAFLTCAIIGGLIGALAGLDIGNPLRSALIGVAIALALELGAGVWARRRRE